jgi:hypothetical protein
MNFGTWMRTSSACRSVGHGSTCMMGQADRKGRTACTAPGHSGTAEWCGRTEREGLRALRQGTAAQQNGAGVNGQEGESRC